MKHKYYLLFLLIGTIAMGINISNAQYCPPIFNSNSCSGMEINNFSTSGGITNITNNNSGCTSGGYSYITNQTLLANPGASIGISVQSGTLWVQGFKIWVDWNNDGDFMDTGEEVWNSGSYATTVFTGSFLVSNNAVTGINLRMRLRCRYAAVPISPCASQGNGEVEDYILKVSPTTNDAGVTEVISPVDDCDGIVQNVEVKIKNLGSNQINGVEVHWTLNNVTQTVFNYTGLLDTAKGTGPDSAIVILGTISLTASASDTIVAWTEMPNNVVDSANGNDTSDVTVVGFDFPTVILTVVPFNTICYGAPFRFNANASTRGSIMYQWKINTVNFGAPTTNNVLLNPPLVYGDSVNVDLLTDDCDTTTYAVPSNYITMFINPEPIAIGGSTADTIIENSTENYLVTLDSGSVFTWSVVGGTITTPLIGNAATVDWAGPMDTARIMVTEKDAGNCSFTNVRTIVIISVVGINEKDQHIGLGMAYPNPANTNITIPVVSDGNWNVDLNLFDITGKKVKAIYTGEISGNRDFTFNVNDLENGIYFYKITTAEGYESVNKISIQH